MSVVYDHLGKRFESVKSMCNYYDITDSMYRGRIKKGHSLAEALTTRKYGFKCISTNKKQTNDHLGNTFDSITEKCEYWGIPRVTYLYRIKRGFTEKEALTIPIDVTAYAKSKKKKDENSVVDHLGNVFPSVIAKCEYWGIPRVTYLRRLHKYGYTEEEALTIPISKRRTSTKLETTV